MKRRCGCTSELANLIVAVTPPIFLSATKEKCHHRDDEPADGCKETLEARRLVWTVPVGQSES